MNNNDLQVLENRLCFYETQRDILKVIMDSLNCWEIFYESCYEEISDFLWQEYEITVNDNLHVMCPELFACHLDFYLKRYFDFEIIIDLF